MKRIKIPISALVSDTSQALGENIRNARERRGYSQGQCAELLKISQAQLSRIEKGRRLPSFKIFVALTRVLDVSADEITQISGGQDGMPAVDQRVGDTGERDDGGGDDRGIVPFRIDLGGWSRK